MTAEPTEPDPHYSAAKLGHDTAARTVASMYGAGMDLDRIKALTDDTSARLITAAQTAWGRAFGSELGHAADSLIRDLREDAAAARGGSCAAVQPDGTPHPDPNLAAKGWHVQSGIYTRRESQPAPDRYRQIDVVPDREAG
jgi:hypothetical protein